VRALRAALVAVALAFPLAIVSPAAAADSFTESWSFTAKKWCGVRGLTVQVDGTVTGTTEVRTRGGVEYYVDHYDVVETHTANGVATTYTESSIAKDLKVTDLGDTLEIIVLATGNATLYGPDGTAIARDPGQFRYRLLIDEKTGKELLFEPILGSTGRSDDFCSVEVPLLLG
jgi:hypothetical protein